MQKNVRLMAVGLLALLSFTAQAAPKAEVWERWTAHDNKSTATIDHSAWNHWLKRYVVPARTRQNSTGGSLLRYGKVTESDRKALDGYLAALQAVPISRYSRAEQKAYWINLYNAATVGVVLDHYPVSSITRINISPGLLARGPWGKRLLRVEGEDLSLNDIEHRILRPIWKDPLVHYGLNCAAKACPDLLPEAYMAGNTNRLLLANARAYVNSPRGARIDNGQLVVSTLYDWYIADFGGSNDGVIAHLKSLAKPDFLKQLSLISRISRHEYDWALNDAALAGLPSAARAKKQRNASTAGSRTAPAAR